MVVTDPAALGLALPVLERELDAMDRACSRFRPDSELAAVNTAAGCPVRVSALFLEALDVAIRAAKVSNGALDPTVGQALTVIGYDRDFASVDPNGSALTVRMQPAPGWRCVQVDHGSSSVAIPNGVTLDLGATAKALCADRAAWAAASHTGAGVLVSLGGDIAVGGLGPPGGWKVRVTHSHADPVDGPGQTVAIHHGGVATSSTTVRRWARGGEILHHLIDPSTGRPVPECWKTVTVAAGSCVDANIASTAAMIMGPAAPAWLARARLPARFVDPAGAVTVVAGWPVDHEVQPCP